MCCSLYCLHADIRDNKSLASLNVDSKLTVDVCDNTLSGTFHLYGGSDNRLIVRHGYNGTGDGCLRPGRDSHCHAQKHHCEFSFHN